MGSSKTGWFFFRSIAETCFFHLLGGGDEPLGTGVVHGDETECLGERNAIGASLKKLDLGVDPPENRVQGYVTQSSLRNGPFGKNSRTARER